MALHCPATLVVVPAPREAKGVTSLLDFLTGERVLAVVTAPGELLGPEIAEALDAPLEEEPGLAGDGTFPSGEDLGAIADLHRGETVLVLTARSADEPTARPVRVEVGSDGIIRRQEQPRP